MLELVATDKARGSDSNAGAPELVNLISLITSPDDTTRNRALDDCCRGFVIRGTARRMRRARGLSDQSENLYERVRRLFFLYAIHRFICLRGRN
jgi:hypothetical protein